MQQPIVPYGRWRLPGTKEQPVRKLGQTLAALARYRRHWSTLLQIDRREARRARASRGDVISPNSPASVPIPARCACSPTCRRSLAPRRRWSSCCTAARNPPRATISAPAGPRSRSATASSCCFPEQTHGEQSEDLLQLVPARRHARDRGEALSIRQMIEKTIGAHGIDRAECSSPGFRPAAR